MSIQRRIADIESTMDRDDVTSVVYGVDRLRGALASATSAEGVLVRLALCPWLVEVERYDDVAEAAAHIRTSPDADANQVLWARYWEAHARDRLDDVDPTDEFLELLAALSDDVSPDASTLGNRLWSRASQTWRPARFLTSYVSWAAPRFAIAADLDRRTMLHRIYTHVDALDDFAAQRQWLTAVLDWPDFDESAWGSPLRNQLAYLSFTNCAFDEARAQYLRVAHDASVSSDPDSGEQEIVARQQAARAAARTGDIATAIRELGDVVQRGAQDPDERLTLAGARLSWVELLLEHAPSDGDRQALAMWRDLGHDADDSLAHLAGLALARSWNELDSPTIIDRATQILSRFSEPHSSELITLVVMTLNSRTRAWAESGDEDAALADAERAFSFDEDDLPDFVRATTARNREALLLRRGDYRERDDIYGVVRKLLDEANAASERGDREGSARSYWRTFEMSQPSPDPATRLVGLAALQDWTVDLLADRDDRRAADIARHSIEAAIVDNGPGTEMLAQAWLQLGVAANRLSDRSTALHAFTQVSAVAGETTVAALVELDSQASWNLAVLLDNGNAPYEALQAYGRVITRTSDGSNLAMQRRVAKALKNSAIVLRDDLNQPTQAGRAWNEIVTRFDGHPDAELSRLVTEAKQNVPRAPRRGLFGRRS